jgi:hypothetical protein
VTKIKSIEIVVAGRTENLDIYTCKDNDEMKNLLREDNADIRGFCIWYYDNIGVFIREDMINDIGLLAHEFLHAVQRFMDSYNYKDVELEAYLLQYIMNSYFTNMVIIKQ